MTLSTHFFSYFLPNLQLNIGKKKYLRTAKTIDESLILPIVLRNYSTKPSSNNKTLNARLLARVITGCHYT